MDESLTGGPEDVAWHATVGQLRAMASNAIVRQNWPEVQAYGAFYTLLVAERDSRRSAAKV